MSEPKNLPAPNYEESVISRWKQNAKEVVPDLNKGEKNLLRRIQKYISSFAIDKKIVEKKIRTDVLFANCFTKDPTRQTIHEDIAFEYLNHFYETLQNLKRLPQGATNDAIYLNSDGIFMTREQTKRKIGKALDFYWEKDSKIFFASHKHTKQSGGAQDNQFNDQKSLLKKFVHNTNENEFLFIICDGLYYKGNRITELKKLESERSFACSIEEVVKIIRCL